MTGVQVTDRGQGEAAGIQIRGLPDALTTLNGRNIFTAAGQSFSLQDISANLIKRVDVYKTRAADQIETGLAGQVDVVTRRPFDFDGFAISALARGIYDQEADTINPNAALLVSDRWETGIGDVGLLVNGSYTRSKFRTMSTTAGAFVPFAYAGAACGYGPCGLPAHLPRTDRAAHGSVHQHACARQLAGRHRDGLPTTPGSTIPVNGIDTPYWLSRDAVFSSDLYGKRERPSVNAALQWAPNSSSVYTAEVYYSGYRGDTFNSLQFSFVDFWANPQAPTLYDGTNIVKSRVANSVYGFNSADYTRSQTDSFVYALNGKWDLGTRGGIVADVAYQTSQTRPPSSRCAPIVSPTRSARPSMRGGVPSYHFDNDALLTDPKVWNVAQLYDNANRDKGSAITGTLDAYYTWDSGFLRQIKGGFRFDDRRASSDVRTADAASLGRPLSSLPAGATFTNSGFFEGAATCRPAGCRPMAIIITTMPTKSARSMA